MLTTSTGWAWQGTWVLEDTAHVLKELSYSSTKEGAYMTSAMGIMWHRKKGLGVWAWRDVGISRRMPSHCKSSAGTGRSDGVAVGPWFLHILLHSSCFAWEPVSQLWRHVVVLFHGDLPGMKSWLEKRTMSIFPSKARQKLKLHIPFTLLPCYGVLTKQEKTNWLGSGVQNNMRMVAARTGAKLLLESPSYM